MLEITIPDVDSFNEETNEFVYLKGSTIRMEHSLVSISKWESKWCKPFLASDEKTMEETIDYIRCMTTTQNVNPLLFYYIPDSELLKIRDYISAPMTATKITDRSRQNNKRIVTSELIYCWMIAENIPMECQKWHINRLLTLIRVCSIESNPSKKKMGHNEILQSNAAINAARRKAMHTKG
jgi:hypothetical protein